MKKKSSVEYMPNLVTKRDYTKRLSANSFFKKTKLKSNNSDKNGSDLVKTEDSKKNSELIKNNVK